MAEADPKENGSPAAKRYDNNDTYYRLQVAPSGIYPKRKLISVIVRQKQNPLIFPWGTFCEM